MTTRATGRDLWHERVASTPDAEFLVSGERVWTYAEADEEMRRIASGLAALGVGCGTRVLVGMEVSAEAVLVHTSLRELGAVLVALVPGSTFAELAYQVNHSEAEVLVVDASVAGTVLPRLAELQRVTTVVADDPSWPGPTLAGLLEHEPWRSVPELHDDMHATAILYTSGSTANPKGVVLPAGSFYSCGKGYAERSGMTAADTFLLPLTVAHGVGAFVAQSMVLHAGGRLALIDRFSPSRFWQQAADAGATLTLLFPAQLNLLLELESAGPAAGGSPLRLVLTHSWNEAFRSRFGIGLGCVWGCTEGGAMGSGTPVGHVGHDGDRYVGPPLLDEHLAIVDPATGNELPAGEPGEVWVTHPHVMLEYLKDPEATARSFAGDRCVRTGDLGVLDERGHLSYHGRIKNMVKRSGENVSPEQLETVLAEHPAVVESLVFGVPDRLRTEELAAAVVVRDTAAVTPAELSSFVAEHLARWKAPRYVATSTEPLARLPNGKIDRVSVIRGFDTEHVWDRERDDARGAS